MHSFWHSTGRNDPPILKIPQDAIFDVYGDEDEDEVQNLWTLSAQHFGRPVSGCRDVDLQNGPKREAARSSLGNFQGILGYINLDWYHQHFYGGWIEMDSNERFLDLDLDVV